MRSIVSLPAVAILSLFTLWTGAAGESQAQESEQAKLKFQANSAEELARSCQEHIAGASDESLHRLVADPDLSIALAAGWERVRRTVPNKELSSVPPAPEALSRFLGLVEGRLPVPIPPVWEAAVRSEISNDGIMIGFPKFMRGLDKDSDVEHADESISVRVRHEGDSWVFDANGKTWSLPVDSCCVENRATITVADDKMFAAIYAHSGNPYSLYVVDRHSGDVRSILKIWASGHGWLWSGPDGQHQVELRVYDDKLYIFGASVVAIYLEVFDVKTGSNLGRFSDEYFAYPLPPTSDPK